jgi:hypothetical protein
MLGLFNMLIQNLTHKGEITSATMFDEEFAKVTVTINGQNYEFNIIKKEEEKKNA